MTTFDKDALSLLSDDEFAQLYQACCIELNRRCVPPLDVESEPLETDIHLCASCRKHHPFAPCNPADL